MIHHGMHSINSLSSFLLGKIQDKPLPLVREKRTTLSIVYLVIGAILLQKDKISAYQFCLYGKGPGVDIPQICTVYSPPYIFRG